MACAPAGPSSDLAQALAARFRDAAAAFIATVESIAPDHWTRSRKAGEWSPGKDAEHAADAAALHLWHLHLTLDQAPWDPPAIERQQLTAERSQSAVLALLRQRTADAATLIERLTDEQLALPAKPPRRPSRTLAQIVERPLIRHLHTHRVQIELKLRALRR